MNVEMSYKIEGMDKLDRLEWVYNMKEGKEKENERKGIVMEYLALDEIINWLLEYNSGKNRALFFIRIGEFFMEDLENRYRKEEEKIVLKILGIEKEKERYIENMSEELCLEVGKKIVKMCGDIWELGN